MDGSKTCEYCAHMCAGSCFFVVCLHLLLACNYFPNHSGKIQDFLIWIKDNLLRERPELFIQNDSVWVVWNINQNVYLNIDWRRLIWIVVFSDYLVISFMSFSFSLARSFSFFLYFVQTARNFGANQWNRLGTFGMNGISFRRLLRLLYSADCFTNFYHPIFFLVLFFSSILLLSCMCACRVNLTTKSSRMTTYCSYQHSTVDKTKNYGQ